MRKILVAVVAAMLVACEHHPTATASPLGPSPVISPVPVTPASVNSDDDEFATRTIQFSGYTWVVRSSYGLPGEPESNFWSNSLRSVWVDTSGRLHLTIRKINGRWYSSDIWLAQDVGYGRYTWSVAGNSGPETRHSVLGMFVYDIATNGEVDVELSHWGRPNGWNVQYMVQPSQVGTGEVNISGSGNYGFEWSPGRVAFNNGTVTRSGVPVPTKPAVHIDFWQCAPCYDTPSQDEEIVVNSFTFSQG